MSSIVSIRQKYKEITGNANADDVPVYDMKQVVRAYEKGREDACIDMFEIKSIVLTRPKFISATKYIEYLQKTFPTKWLLGWNDSDCKTYELLIPTVKEQKNE